MKFFGKITLFVFLNLIFITSVFAAGEQQYVENWQIDSFHSDITIKPSGQIDVTESIIANFENEEHRGIARTIPYDQVRLDFKSATDETGNPWKTEEFDYRTIKEIQMTNWQDEYNNETHSFILNYTASNVFTYFDDHDELYWNINGTDWVVSTKQITATIHLPKSLKKEEVKLACYTGAFEEQFQNCKFDFRDNLITFAGTDQFYPYENLTIVIGLPKNTIRPAGKSAAKNFEKPEYAKYLENSPLLLPFLTLAITIYIWRKHGRDDQTVRNTIMPHYKPPKDLVPTQTGTIIDEKIDPRDITATIIDFAVKGFIKINEIEEEGLLFNHKDYELELIKPYTTTYEFEKIIMEAIFSKNEKGEKKKISDLKNKFYKHIKPIEKSVIKQLIKDDFFPHDPHKIRTIGYSIGGVALFSSFQLGGITGAHALTIGLFFSGIIILIMTHTFPRKTKKGTETYYILKGLYEYIDTAEKDRMKFQEENNIIFEKLLPYAISFGLVEKWTDAFEGILKVPPTWFYPHGGWHSQNFNMTAFAHDLDKFNNNLTDNIATAPGKSGGAWSGGSGFGGGGFSGGGFGGGGGRGL